MKYLKMLGLAAVAAAALMAFVGGSTASATVLCKTTPTKPQTPEGTTCPPNQAYPAGTKIHAVNEEHTVLTTEFLNVTCTESTVEGETENEGSATETVKGPITVLTFNGCNCTVNVLKRGSLEVHWIEGTHNGTLKSSGAEVTVECSTIFGKVHCIYTTNATDLGTLTGGKTATMDISSAGIPRVTTSALCDPTSNWDAKYNITTPDELYVAGHT